MSIESKAVHDIARLARLKLSAQEAENLSQEIGNILKLVEQMNSVDTEHVSPMTHPFDATLRLRADEVTAVDQRETLQALAADAKQGLYRVPKVID